MKPILTSALTAAMLGGCQTMDEAPAGIIAKATLLSASGEPAGTARLYASGTETTLSLSLTGIHEGLHGVHLHAFGSCELPAFTSAGPHLNPASRQHGFENAQGAHLGDLPNVMIAASGAGTVSALLPGAPKEVIPQLFDADGTAILVHAGADDYRTDPSGNSGERIACGVLTRH